jgi:hypothetical protein
MFLDLRRQRVVVGCLAVVFLGCGESSGAAGVGGGGAGGVAGSGGAGGTVAPPPQVPGLWEADANGVSVCFFIGDDGLKLISSASCDLPSASGDGAHSFDLGADLVGTDENGQRCSFVLAYTNDVTIDQETNSFRVAGFQVPDSDVVLSFTGELSGRTASGVARSESAGSLCQVAWAAKPVTVCDDAAIQTCLALQTCCESILLNPTFFQSCNSVVLQCNRARCQELLDGYPQCAPQ